MTKTHWLMLRGLAREKRHWGEFPAVFAGALDADTFTMDLPGFGTESARVSPTSISAITDDLRARFLRERPAGEAWSLLAISLGGMVALDWCARYPSDFARCVVINTSAADLSLPHERFLVRNWPTVVRTALTDNLARERNILSMTVNSPSVDKEAIAQRWAAWGRERAPLRESFVKQLYAATTSKLPKKLDVPVLVLASRADRLVSVRCSEKIAARLGVPIALHTEGGHDLSLDAPEWICAEVRRFVV